MKRVARNHTKKIEKAIKGAKTIKAYNEDNSWKGEVIQIDEKLANSVIEDIKLQHATMYQLANDREFEIHWTPRCYWKASH